VLLYDYVPRHIIILETKPLCGGLIDSPRAIKQRGHIAACELCASPHTCALITPHRGSSRRRCRSALQISLLSATHCALSIGDDAEVRHFPSIDRRRPYDTTIVFQINNFTELLSHTSL
jgi:hypothetical protein